MKEIILIFIILIVIILSNYTMQSRFTNHPAKLLTKTYPRVKFADILQERVFSKKTGEIIGERKILI